MKTQLSRRQAASGNALVVTMVLTATALLTLAGVMAWSGGGARVSARYQQYNLTVAAAEAGTQKAVGQLWSDFQSGGEALVILDLNNYRTNIPSASDSANWTNWTFSDAQGNTGRTYVQALSSSNYTSLSGTYAGLKGFVSVYDIVSDASQVSGLQSVTMGNLQEVQLTRIPIFQWLLYSSENLEVGCTQPFGVGGYVHANGNLYSEPDCLLVYDQAVTTVGGIVNARSPQDSRPAPSWPSFYLSTTNTGVSALVLPIGTNNSPTAIQQIIQVPPAGESPTSPLGRARYYNQSDMLISVSAQGVISGSSGLFNSFLTTIPSNQMAMMVNITNSFYDGREKKTVKPIDIDIGLLTSWSATNNTLRSALGGRDLYSVYVMDARTLGTGYLPAVRLKNGALLPSLGLTVATALPLYVWGNYNQSVSNNFSAAQTSLPSSLVCDAVTVLSSAWVDANSTLPLSSRPAAPNNTLIAALLTGAVYTTNGYYSGGMENFIRLLEDWSNSTFWYTGSLIKMFPSAYATGYWPGTGTVYNYPGNNHYYFDLNYNSSTGLPPLTPSLETISLTKWMTLTPNQVTGTNALY